MLISADYLCTEFSVFHNIGVGELVLQDLYNLDPVGWYWFWYFFSKHLCGTRLHCTRVMNTSPSLLQLTSWPLKLYKEVKVGRREWSGAGNEPAVAGFQSDPRYLPIPNLVEEFHQNANGGQWVELKKLSFLSITCSFCLLLRIVIYANTPGQSPSQALGPRSGFPSFQTQSRHEAVRSTVVVQWSKSLLRVQRERGQTGFNGLPNTSSPITDIPSYCSW